MTVAEAARRGFLVSGFDIEQYADFLNRAEYFLVAVYDDRIVAMLLAYRSETIRCDESSNMLLRLSLQRPFVLIKQVVVDAAHAGKGIGTKLYRSLIENEPELDLIAVVVEQPPNERSAVFHARNGFSQVAQLLPLPDVDGQVRSRSVWFRPAFVDRERLPALRIRFASVGEQQGVLSGQLENALGLYTHEDNLNWTKFGQLITFMLALFAGFSFIWEAPASISNGVIGLFLILGGFMINWIFSRKLRSGLLYMESHKARVCELEQRLKRLDPGFVPIITVDDVRIAGRSQTVQLMQWVPRAAYGVWTLCSVALLPKLYLAFRILMG